MRALLAAVCLSLIAAPLLAASLEAPPAPRFNSKTVEGGRVDLAELLERGPVLIDFWATWCQPCARSLPHVRRMHETYGGQGLAVIGVSIDGPRNFAKVRPFVRRFGLAYPIVLDDDGSLQQNYRVSAVPTAVLVGRDGRIVHTETGWQSGQEKRLEAAIRAAMATTDSASLPAE